ncbi:hypothetical protein FH972_026364 [Carpinus fangiana]|uniref:Xylose isomerase-like TIM barrel domain-containing protein n=1 Tax=Carpinus fangiana TaxID=176857 RepID=A0A5N6L3T4_9ROSI|nr:hypothetical protein FH972_026364 [Carpinus fangiana]
MPPCLPAISSMSIGRCAFAHPLMPKLTAAAKHGFSGVEIFEEDLVAHAKDHYHSDSLNDLLATAHDIHAHCKSIGLRIVCLQPFRAYEGLTDPAAHAAKIAEWKRWLLVARALHTDLVSVASTFGLPDGATTGDVAAIAADLAELADLAAAAPGEPPLRVSFEALAWGAHVDTWERSWEVVQRADRPNLGICLDTFNIAARVFADPAVSSGRTGDAEEAMRASIARTTELIDVEKVFNVQVVDGERLREPLIEGHAFYDADQPARMSWSRNCRLFYGEQDRGAYLPVTEICRAIFEGLGYQGWVSMELFSRTCAKPGDTVIEEHTARGIKSWVKLCKDMNVDMVGVRATEQQSELAMTAEAVDVTANL